MSKARLAKVVSVLNEVSASLQRMAASKYLIKIGDQTVDPLDFAKASDLQDYLEENFDYSAPPYQWTESHNVEYVGPFPKIRLFSPTTAKPGDDANITIRSPFGLWVVAHVAEQGYGVPEALLYMDTYENLSHLDAQKAQKILNKAVSGWDYMEMFEYDGDRNRFFGSVASDYEHVAKEMDIIDVDEASDRDVAQAVIREVLNEYDRGWYEADGLVFTVYG